MSRRNRFGFMLLEIVVVIAILAALLSIAVPSYITYTEKARKAACLANRHNVEQDERARNLNTGAPSLVIDHHYQCPSGGVYAWLVTDPKDPHYPRVGCSLHYASGPDQGERTYQIDLGKDALKNTVKELFASFRDYAKIWQSEQNKMPQVAVATGSISWNAALQTDSPYAANRLSAKFWNEYFQYLEAAAINATNREIADFKLFFKHDQVGNITPDIAGVYLKTANGYSGIYFSTGEVISGNEKNGAYHYKNYIKTVGYTGSGTAIGELKYKAIDGVK